MFGHKNIGGQLGDNESKSRFLRIFCVFLLVFRAFPENKRNFKIQIAKPYNSMSRMII